MSKALHWNRHSPLMLDGHDGCDQGSRILREKMERERVGKDGTKYMHRPAFWCTFLGALRKTKTVRVRCLAKIPEMTQTSASATNVDCPKSERPRSCRTPASTWRVSAQRTRAHVRNSRFAYGPVYEVTSDRERFIRHRTRSAACYICSKADVYIIGSKNLDASIIFF